MFMRVFTVWVAALSLVTATSPCGDACDSETSELLQVTRKAEQVTTGAKKESVHDDAGDLLKFRVVPVNEDRDFFSKIRPKKIALAMTGGGGGTTAGATGQFRALNSMGLLEKVDEATASGGAGIAAVILAYAKGHTVEELLGEETFGALSSLDRAEIKTPNGKILERVSTLSDPYVAVAANPFFGLSPEKLEEVVLAGRFLCPFGLNGKIPAFNAFKVGPFAEFDLCGNNNKNQVFTSSQKRLDWIQKRNPDLDVSDALLLNGNLKSVALTATLLSPEGYDANTNSVQPIRFGPDFSGIPYYADQQTVDFEPWKAGLSPLNNVVIGGGLVETFAFMATPPPENQGGRRLGFNTAELGPEGPVSLQEAMGFSNAQFGLLGKTNPAVVNGVIQQTVAAGGQDFTAEFAEDPYLFSTRRTYWPVADKKGLQGDIEAKTYYIQGGFISESAQLLQTIRFGAECSVVLLNNIAPIEDPSVVDFCDASTVSAIEANPDQLLATQFGFLQSVYDYFGIALSAEFFSGPLTQDFTKNQVFELSELAPLFCEAQQLKAAGKAVVVNRTYTTMENLHWGIDAGKVINVVWVWNELATGWFNELPAETQQDITNGDFNSPWNTLPLPFPALRAALPSPDASDFSALIPEQGNLYASLAEWTLRQSEDKLRSCMGVH